MTDLRRDEIARSVTAIRRAHDGDFPVVALILGSGLGKFGEHLKIDTIIPYADVPGFPVSTVVGHEGRLLIGRAGRLPLICMQGRMHLYEGYPAQDLAIPIRTLRALGVNALIITNAAGSLRTEMPPGTLMALTDHINMSSQNPLIGPNDDDMGPRFFDMSDAYDPDLRDALMRAAKETGVDVSSGVYLQASGPNFETPAEVRMFAQWGADAVGMSTVPECLVARHCGMRVAGLSVITNMAAGLSNHALSHQETLDEAEKAYGKMSALLLSFFNDLASSAHHA